MSDSPGGQDYFEVTADFLRALRAPQLPLDVYRFHPEQGRPVVVFRAGEPACEATLSQIQTLSRSEPLFIHSSQRDVYLKYVALQPDLVLQDDGLSPAEATGVLYDDLVQTLNRFYDDPSQATARHLEARVQILAAYVLGGADRMTEFVCRLHSYQSPEHKRVNVALLGMAVYLAGHKKPPAHGRLADACLALLVHDIGMTRIPRFVIDRTSALKPEERKRLRGHPGHSAEILVRVGLGREPLISCAQEHHERLDGSGYPDGLTAERIGPLSRVCAVADSYAAMIAEMPYSQSIRPVKAAADLLTDRRRYDIGCTSLLLRVLQDATC